jgi:hypothetical protein
MFNYGDVVVIKPGGWNWTGNEHGPKFKLLKMPKVPISMLEFLVEPVVKEKYNLLTQEIFHEIVKNRKNRIALSELTEEDFFYLADKKVDRDSRVEYLMRFVVKA